MSKRLICFLMMLALAGATSGAQEASGSSLLNGIRPLDSGSDPTSPPSTASSQAGLPSSKTKGQADPTEITSTNGVSYENQTRTAVFTGDVHVKHPQFTLAASKLTAILKKDAAKTEAKPAQPASPVKTPDLPGGGGGLEKVIAEGNVVIIQDKPATNGSAPTRYVAKAARAEYDSATGNVTLIGWPQVAQGINMQVATEESTVMILNRDGKMITSGGSKTIIQDTGKDETGKTAPHP
jgi:lipopolysaccharide export system protein LptA